MNDIHPLKPLIKLTIFDTVIPYVAGLVLLALFFVLTVKIMEARRLAKLRAESVGDTDINPVEEIEAALLRLDKLRQLIKDEQLAEFYLAVTELIKDSLAEVFGVKVKEMTTKEIEKIKLEPALRKIVLEFLHQVDRLKFSGLKSQKEEAEELYGVAEDCLHKMRDLTQAVKEPWQQRGLSTKTEI